MEDLPSIASNVLPLLHERQRAKGIERNRGDEPFERPEQQPLVHDLADEGEDDACQRKDGPEHRNTSPLLSARTHLPIAPTRSKRGDIEGRRWPGLSVSPQAPSDMLKR